MKFCRSLWTAAFFLLRVLDLVSLMRSVLLHMLHILTIPADGTMSTILTDGYAAILVAQLTDFWHMDSSFTFSQLNALQLLYGHSFLRVCAHVAHFFIPVRHIFSFMPLTNVWAVTTRPWLLCSAVLKRPKQKTKFDCQGIYPSCSSQTITFYKIRNYINSVMQRSA